MNTKKVKVSYFIITLALLLFILPNTIADAASKYKGGLLDDVALQTGTSMSQPSATPVTTLTDDSASTRAYINTGSLLWHSFTTPQEVNALILHKTSGSATVEFYDANNNLLLSYVPIVNDGTVTLPTPLSNVSTVVLKVTTGGYFYEWNIFETPSAPPIVPVINWFYGGDKVAEIFWGDTGASSYNIKRSDTSGGPYALIASNITGTSYTDRTVNNGAPYHYVVSSVNLAGESANSAEQKISPNSTKYTGGLLDGLMLNTGKNISSPTGTVREITDNNAGTRQYVDTSSLIWHSFASPQEINAVILHKSAAVNPTVEFYDANNNLLLSYVPVVSDGVVTLPTPLSNVSTVVLKTTSSYGYVYEWNVFKTHPVAPIVPAIDWIYGGDTVVQLFWGDTGANSYNVKRATSKGGPYALIASNIRGTSYTDRNVANGTTYFYVVTAVNPTAESGNSIEKEIKPSSTKYTGGLLDGLVLNTGKNTSTLTGTLRQLTDNNTGTRQYVDTGSLVWHTFSSPKEINGFIVNKTNGAVTVELYDANNNLLSSQVPAVNDVVEALPTPIPNVTTVVLKMTSGGYIVEWNVFGSGIDVEAPVEELGLSATAGNSKVQLSWSAVSTATSYKIQRSTTSGGPYSVIDTVSSSTYSYTDNNVVNGTTYYYIVTAVGAVGDVATSNEASATPRSEVVPPIEEVSGNRALLFIMLSTGEIKEYDLSMNEVNAFIQWYETRANGVGPITFAIDKHNNNKGPFTNRKDYIIYDKIITFEVNAYENPNSTTPTYPTSPIEH